MPSDSTLTLFIPDLFAFQSTFSKLTRDELSQLPEFKLATLEKWLSRGRWEKSADQSDSVFSELGLSKYRNTEKPFAALSLLTENSIEKDTCFQSYWLRADPVCLQADRDTALLVAHEELALTGDEANNLVDLINTHFIDEPWQLYSFSPHRWYLRLEQPIDLITTPLETVLGEDINRFAPSGNDAGYWHKITNEMQMLLHGSSVNFERDSRNFPTANSVWLWGGGILHEKTGLSNYHSLITDNRIFKGIGHYCEVDIFSLDTDNIDNIEHGLHLIILDMLSSYVQQHDLYSFVQTLNSIVESYLLSCNELLLSGKINEIKLITDKGNIVINKKLLRRWWKRKKSFLSF